ncbi:hypothetical protein SKAU_G00008150 [Synaphobranchus kaupii]|uniref:Uncharacterized protein n=1 Tax=Synaphobranchus kaupii TaxID=118154 RepID=A0A9Q1JD24_SYNKA|nr:hypothetical protein SKAU_G00008150 [Synaphobranchus kaupii]
MSIRTLSRAGSATIHVTGTGREIIRRSLCPSARHRAAHLSGERPSRAVSTAPVTAITTSILTMTCIAVERFKGILYPLKLRSGYSPCHAMKMLGKLNLSSDHEFMVFSTVQILGFSNSVCNPLVYAALNSKFKKDLAGLLRRGRGKGWCPAQQLTGKARVGVPVTEPARLRKRAEKDDRGVLQSGRVAWGAEPVTSLAFPQVHLFRAATKKTSSPLLVNVTDPLPISTSGT